jgi:hypothetical protein
VQGGGAGEKFIKGTSTRRAARKLRGGMIISENTRHSKESIIPWKGDGVAQGVFLDELLCRRPKKLGIYWQCLDLTITSV